MTAQGRDNPSDWSVRDLERLFFIIVSELSRLIYIFIDGLNEAFNPSKLEKLLE